ncbi:ABC transporter substrate-binding protein [Rhabdothermincola salaria]|uniref:ABC transporter substrate-binding protein n=1 Tax=Rhabdothermincola salaria TaxID=2903142 RepID=UPI001E4791A7|nr:ABC transporter substrate-binding protein [Rhabdothermincola salaria]MCD9625112.1 ABC transporter substrate-binding protein [Rhabdothermincola salaria]
MKHYRVLAVLLALGLVAAACGRDGGTTATPTEPGSPDTTEAAGDEACEGVELEATDTGVTADTITIQVMADTGSPLAPGLFQGNVDALEGFETFINDNGGIACRELVVEAWDSKLTPEETKNGQINACANAVALVGGNSLFNPDVSTMNTCPDAEGNPTGMPNVAALANDVNEQCSNNTFIITGTAEPCNDDGTPISGERDLLAFIGNIEYYQTIEPDLTGLFMVPGDLPTTVQSATYQIEAQRDAGVDIVGAFKVSGRAEQSAYTPLVQQARSSNANYVYNGSNDVAMTLMRREAAAQGLDSVEVWACSLACYTEKFQEAGGDVEGTYVWMQFLPFEDEGSNEALDNYLASVETPDSFGAQAWMAALLFQEAVNGIVESDGPNAITRASLIEALNGIDSFDAGGWMGPKDPKGGFSDCMVIMQMGADGFERAFPEEPGTLECDPAAVVEVTLDPAVAAESIQ